MKDPVRLPQVGDIAEHKAGLDDRPVSQVSNNGKSVKLMIGNIETEWVPADNYIFHWNPRYNYWVETD